MWIEWNLRSLDFKKFFTKYIFLIGASLYQKGSFNRLVLCASIVFLLWQTRFAYEMIKYAVICSTQTGGFELFCLWRERDKQKRVLMTLGEKGARYFVPRLFYFSKLFARLFVPTSVYLNLHSVLRASPSWLKQIEAMTKNDIIDCQAQKFAKLLDPDFRFWHLNLS